MRGPGRVGARRGPIRGTGGKANGWPSTGPPSSRVEYEDSLAACRSCVESDSTFARAHLMMGYCAIQLDRPSEAIAPLEKAASFPEQSDKAGRLLSAVRALVEG
jgi:hypothetical protein